jgi:hypothetical protein
LIIRKLGYDGNPMGHSPIFQSAVCDQSSNNMTFRMAAGYILSLVLSALPRGTMIYVPR